MESPHQSSSSTPAQAWTQNEQQKANASTNTSSSAPSWCHNNVARAEEGTTFYFRQNIS